MKNYLVELAGRRVQQEVGGDAHLLAVGDRSLAGGHVEIEAEMRWIWPKSIENSSKYDENDVNRGAMRHETSVCKGGGLNRVPGALISADIGTD